MDFEKLSAVLWHERELLELLAFKAEEKRYIMVTGKTQWLPRVAAGIEDSLAQLRILEVERAAQTEAIAKEAGLDPNASLRQLAAIAPEPWQDILTDHYDALFTLVSEIRSISEANKELAESGLKNITDTLARAAQSTPSAGTYTASGRQTADTYRAVTLDGTL